MPIMEGSEIPKGLQGTVMGDEGPKPMDLTELFAGKKTVLFGVPGAFTPTCSNDHLPSYVNAEKSLEEKGIDQVVCMSTNDIFVLNAWNGINGGDNIKMLADGSGEITRALDLGLDLNTRGMGFRTTRFSMIIDDNVVVAMNIEEAPGTCTLTSADELLSSL